MAYYVDSQGRLVEANPQDNAGIAALQTQGLRPATQQDIDAHNNREAARAAPLGEAALRAGQRTVGGAAQAIGEGLGLAAPVPAGLEGEGASPAEQVFPEAYDARARALAEERPIESGIGQALTAAPVALGAGALAAGAAGGLGAGALASTGAGILSEAGVEAVAQEYDDAWLEQRPMELSNVAALTAMFGIGDVALRGIGKAIGSRLGRKNVVAEANNALRPKAPGGLVGRSVGAARAADLDEPFDKALREMSDRDALILDRDSDDYLNLIAMHSADGMNALRRGLDEDLSSPVKYQDWAKYAEQLTGSHLEKQARWLDEILEDGAGVAKELQAFKAGSEEALDFGNMGRGVLKDVNDFSRRISAEQSGAGRMRLIDEYKKRLDQHMMKIDASFSVDAGTREGLKKQIRPLVERLRAGLENPAMFGEAAKLQRELNPGWHELLKHWGLIQKKLFEKTGERLYDHAGAGRIVQEAGVKGLFDLFSTDPRFRREMGEHLAGAFDGLSDLIRARQRLGITRRDNLDSLLQHVANLKEDWNLAGSVGVAKNMVKNAKKDPRKWAGIIAGVAERAPVVGGAIGGARVLGRLAEGTNLKRGSPLAEVWGRGLERYAGHEALQDPGIARNYSDWMREALKQHGGKIAGAAAGAGAIGYSSEADASPVVPYRHAMRENAAGGSALMEDYAARMVTGKTPAIRRERNLLAGDVQENVKTAIAELREALTDPETLLSNISAGTGELYSTHPTVYESIVAMTMQSLSYLSETAPAPIGSDPLEPGSGTITYDDAMAFAERQVGALRPRETIADMIAGVASEEQVEALTANWQPLLETMRTSVLGRVSKMRAAGQDIDQETAKRLDRQLGLDGMLDATSSIQFAEVMVGAEQAGMEEAGQSQGSGQYSGRSTSEAYETTLQSATRERTMDQ